MSLVASRFKESIEKNRNVASCPLLARLRAGQDGRSQLASYAARLDLKKWPGAVVSLYLGKSTPGALLAAARDAGDKCGRRTRPTTPPAALRFTTHDPRCSPRVPQILMLVGYTRNPRLAPRGLRSTSVSRGRCRGRDSVTAVWRRTRSQQLPGDISPVSKTTSDDRFHFLGVPVERLGRTRDSLNRPTDRVSKRRNRRQPRTSLPTRQALEASSRASRNPNNSFVVS
jgi:hypothetical protein